MVQWHWNRDGDLEWHSHPHVSAPRRGTTVFARMRPGTRTFLPQLSPQHSRATLDVQMAGWTTHAWLNTGQPESWRAAGGCTLCPRGVRTTLVPSTAREYTPPAAQIGEWRRSDLPIFSPFPPNPLNYNEALAAGHCSGRAAHADLPTVRTRSEGTAERYSTRARHSMQGKTLNVR